VSTHIAPRPWPRDAIYRGRVLADSLRELAHQVGPCDDQGGATLSRSDLVNLAHALEQLATACEQLNGKATP
jgi:hypothetical protein